MVGRLECVVEVDAEEFGVALLRKLQDRVSERNGVEMLDLHLGAYQE